MSNVKKEITATDVLKLQIVDPEDNEPIELSSILAHFLAYICPKAPTDEQEEALALELLKSFKKLLLPEDLPWRYDPENIPSDRTVVVYTKNYAIRDVLKVTRNIVGGKSYITDDECRVIDVANIEKWLDVDDSPPNEKEKW